jgi:hypothetical protein
MAMRVPDCIVLFIALQSFQEFKGYLGFYIQGMHCTYRGVSG